MKENNELKTLLEHDSLLEIVTFNLSKIKELRDLKDNNSSSFNNEYLTNLINETLNLVKVSYFEYKRDALNKFKEDKLKLDNEYKIKINNIKLEKKKELLPINNKYKELKRHSERNSSLITKIKEEKNILTKKYRIKLFELKKEYKEELNILKEDLKYLNNEEYYLIAKIKNKKFLIKEQIDKFKYECRKFFNLSNMLLQDKLEISYKSNINGFILKILIGIFTFCLITALSYGFYLLSGVLGIFSLGSIPIHVPVIINLIILILTIFSATINITKSLYFSSDQDFIKTLPLKPKYAFFSKLFVFFIYELIRSFKFIIPMLLGYAIYRNLGILTYINTIISFIPIIILITLISALFSIPTYYFMKFLNKYSYLKTSLLLIFSIVFLSLFIYLTLLIPTNIDMNLIWNDIYSYMQDIFLYFEKNFYFLFYLVSFSIGTPLPGWSFDLYTISSLYTFLSILTLIILLLILVSLIVNPIYFKVTSKSINVSKKIKVYKERQFKVKNKYLSIILKDFKLFITNNNIISSNVVTFIILPIIILLLNKIFGALNTALFGNMMITGFNMLIILLISLNSNAGIAKIYSFEGSAFKINKNTPIKSFIYLTLKLLIPALIGLTSIIISLVIFSINTKVNNNILLFTSIGIIFIYLGHMLYSAYNDFLKPETNFNELGNITKSEGKSIISAFIISLLYSGFGYFLINDNPSYGPLKIMLIGLIYFIFTLIFYKLKIKYYYELG